MALNAGSIEIKLFADIARLQSDMNKANKTVDSAMGKIDKAVGLARRAFSGLAGAFGAAQIAKIADEYKKFDSQLQLSTRNLKDYTAAYENTIRISRIAQSDISAVGVLYARLNNNLREFNVTQNQVANVTENIALALRVNNATVQETSSVMLQLSQSFGSGRLNGQEFLAVAEGAPALLRQLAKSMGVPFGALKDLSSQGKITREELLKAFNDPAYLEANRQMVKSVGTISSAFNVLTNNLKLFIGEGDKATGISRAISSGIIFLADNINVLATIAVALLIRKLGLLTASLFASMQASRLRQVEMMREQIIIERKAAAEAIATAATANNARAVTMAAHANSAAATEMAAVNATLASRMTVAARAAGVLRTAMMALGGPIGAIITALGLGVTAWLTWGNQGKQSADDIAAALGRVKEGMESLNDAKMIQVARNAMAAEKRALELPRSGLQKGADVFKYGSIEAADEARRVAIGELERQIKSYDAALQKHNGNQKENLSVVDKLAPVYDKLAKAGKILSVELAEQNQLIADAKQLYDAKKITLADYNKVVEDANQKKNTLLGLAKAEKAEAKEMAVIHKEAIKQAIELAKQQQELHEANAKARNEAIDTLDKTAEAMQKEIDKLEESIGKMTLTEDGYRRLELARLQDAAATARQIVEQGKLNGLTGDALTYGENVIKSLEKQVELKEKANSLEQTEEFWKRAQKIEEEKAKAAEKGADKLIKENDRVADAMENALTNAIFRGFESGKSFAFNFKDALISSFKTLILRPLVKFALDASGISAVGAAISGALGGDSVTGAVGGTGNNVFGLLKQGFDAMNTGVVGSIEKLGVFLSTGNGGLGDTIGGFLGANASTIASALTYSDAIIKLASGDVKGAAFSGAGAAIGTYFGGPVGGAIGSFIGSAVGSLFGGGAKTKKSSTGATTSYKDGIFSSSSSSGIAGYNRSLGGADALTSIGEAYSKTMGSLFKAFNLSDEVMTAASMFQRASKKIRTWVYWSATFGSGGGVSLGSMGGRQDAQTTINQLIEAVFTRGITEGVKNSNLPASIKLLFDGMVDKNQVANMVNTTIGLANANQALIDTFNITAEQAASVALQSGQVGDELGKVINAMIESARASRFAGDALYEFRGRLEDALGRSVYGSLKEYDNALKAIDKTTEEGIATFYDLFALRGDFVTFQNALDGLKGGVRGAIFSLVSDEQKLIMQQEDMAKVFADLGQDVPGSTEELVALGKSIDFTTKEGLNLASIFPTLVQMFSQTKSTVDGLITSLSSLDSSRFRTLFEFTRAQAYARNGIPLSSLPSYAVGTNYVPNDGLAMIHQGERIIPASDNARLTGDMTAMVNEVRQLRQEMQAQNVSIATSNAKMQKIFQRWDGEGIPYFRDIDGNGVVVDVNVTNP